MEGEGRHKWSTTRLGGEEEGSRRKREVSDMMCRLFFEGKCFFI